jgi:hypothetical protein
LVLEDAVRNIYTVVAFCAGNKVCFQLITSIRTFVVAARGRRVRVSALCLDSVRIRDGWAKEVVGGSERV